jgi:type III secretion protein V
VVLSAELEAMLRESVRTNAGVQQLALEPETAARLMEEFRLRVAETGVGVIITAIDLRRHVRKLIEPDLFDTSVLSFHELHPTLKLEVAHTVQMSFPAGLLAAE